MFWLLRLSHFFASSTFSTIFSPKSFSFFITCPLWTSSPKQNSSLFFLVFLLSSELHPYSITKTCCFTQYNFHMWYIPSFNDLKFYFISFSKFLFLIPTSFNEIYVIIFTWYLFELYNYLVIIITHSHKILKLLILNNSRILWE